jgi:hypothetical protein
MKEERKETISPGKAAQAAFPKRKKKQKKMSLPELRQVRNISQGYLAYRMDKKQPNLSKLERSTDMYVSTLHKFIRAMGGKLEIIAHFSDGVIQINQFDSISRKEKG